MSFKEGDRVKFINDDGEAKSGDLAEILKGDEFIIDINNSNAPFKCQVKLDKNSNTMDTASENLKLVNEGE